MVDFPAALVDLLADSLVDLDTRRDPAANTIQT
ncbi:hypothetical protein FHX42_005254 [Saccharopolyspora lacisalsi]|uniref:Uncharacterized protein n=1 Tax=Halosaccharopolyspora lacisalsi TaxID=1000566 RepID=A0A839E824_9PSEU|nr:hypothetical protein [Halosaccharopolyspora lacisalsi]